MDVSLAPQSHLAARKPACISAPGSLDASIHFVKAPSDASSLRRDKIRPSWPKSEDERMAHRELCRSKQSHSSAEEFATISDRRSEAWVAMDPDRAIKDTNSKGEGQ